jgi:hypothetical protein
MANKWLIYEPLLAIRRRLLPQALLPTLQSDVSNALYLNWVVDCEAAKEFMPPSARIWQRNNKTIFTVLAYTHGNFGPAILGPFRKLFPSPHQSNWRFYIDQFPVGIESNGTVLFVKNIINNALYTAASRLLSDALPSDMPLEFHHKMTKESIYSQINYGNEEIKTIKVHAILGREKILPQSMKTFFSNWLDAVKFICLQDSAITFVKTIGKVSRAEIELDFNFDQVQAIVLEEFHHKDDYLSRIGIDENPFCFFVPSVRLKAISERII